MVTLEVLENQLIRIDRDLISLANDLRTVRNTALTGRIAEINLAIDNLNKLRIQVISQIESGDFEEPQPIIEIVEGTREFFQLKVRELTQEVLELENAIKSCVINPSSRCTVFPPRLVTAKASLEEFTNLLNASITRSLDPPITEQPPIIEIDPIVEGEPISFVEPIIGEEPVVKAEPQKQPISSTQLAIIGGIALLLI